MVYFFLENNEKEEGDQQPTFQTFNMLDDQDEDIPMQAVDMPPSNGLIVNDEPTNMSIVMYNKVSTRVFDIDLDDYSRFLQKETQDNVNIDEANNLSPQPHTRDAENTQVDTDKAHIPTSPKSSKPGLERMKLNAQMIAERISLVSTTKNRQCLSL